MLLAEARVHHRKNPEAEIFRDHSRDALDVISKGENTERPSRIQALVVRADAVSSQATITNV